MPQGEAISALVRAWKITKRNEFLDSAKKAFNLLTKPIEEGGTSYFKNGDVFLEEYPATSKNTILNGWIFAIEIPITQSILSNNDRFSRVPYFLTGFYNKSSTFSKNISLMLLPAMDKIIYNPIPRD